MPRPTRFEVNAVRTELEKLTDDARILKAKMQQLGTRLEKMEQTYDDGIHPGIAGTIETVESYLEDAHHELKVMLFDLSSILVARED